MCEIQVHLAEYTAAVCVPADTAAAHGRPHLRSDAAVWGQYLHSGVLFCHNMVLIPRFLSYYSISHSISFNNVLQLKCIPTNLSENTIKMQYFIVILYFCIHLYRV